MCTLTRNTRVAAIRSHWRRKVAERCSSSMKSGWSTPASMLDGIEATHGTEVDTWQATSNGANTARSIFANPLAFRD